MKLHLDQKFFIPFAGAMAVVFIAIIAVYSMEYAKHQRGTFRDMANRPGLFDTLRVTGLQSEETFLLKDSLSGPAVLVFWAGWSEQSVDFLFKTVKTAEGRPESVQIVGLLVKDSPDRVLDVLGSTPKVLHIIGTPLYHRLKAVGVPSIIVLDSSGTVRAAGIGSETDIEALLRN